MFVTINGTEHGLLRLLFFLFLMNRGVILNEIGEKLREARESHGVSIEEAAEDLKIRPTQLKNLEEGNIKEFKDIFYVKFFVRDYAKYLGLDGEKILDDFNEFLFDYTSRIPLDKIKEANEAKKEEPKKIVSPYTMPQKKNFFLSAKFIYLIIALIVIIIGYLIVSSFRNDDFEDGNTVYQYVIE